MINNKDESGYNDYMELKIRFLRFFSFINKLFYGNFGKRSAIISPIRIIGRKNIFIGKRCLIRDGARIECIYKWNNLKFNPKLRIGDGTNIEQSVHITFASNLTIGKNCSIAPRVMITTIDHDYSKIDIGIMKNDILTRDVTIGDNCFFGIDVKIFPGVTIGNNCIVGANSLVMSDLPDYCVAVGCPAKIIKRFDKETQKWINLKNNK